MRFDVHTFSGKIPDLVRGDNSTAPFCSETVGMLMAAMTVPPLDELGYCFRGLLLLNSRQVNLACMNASSVARWQEREIEKQVTQCHLGVVRPAGRMTTLEMERLPVESGLRLGDGGLCGTVKAQLRLVRQGAGAIPRAHFNMVNEVLLQGYRKPASDARTVTRWTVLSFGRAR